MLHWPHVTRLDAKKIRDLYFYYEKAGDNYYTFCALTESVMYMNGDLRNYGTRIPMNNNRQ